MNVWRKALAVLALLFLLPCAAGARTKFDVHDWNNVKFADLGDRMIVKTKSNGIFVGYITKVTGAALTLDISLNTPLAPSGAYGFSRTIDRADVLQVRKEKGSRLLSGLLGAGIGIAAGVGIGAAVDARSRSVEDKGLAPAVLGVMGGAIGAGVGASNPFKGKTIYQAP